MEADLQERQFPETIGIRGRGSIIRPDSWTYDNELLDLLWVLDNTIDLLPNINQNLEKILQSNLINAEIFPKPSVEELHSKTNLSLFDFAGIDIEEIDEIE